VPENTLNTVIETEGEIQAMLDAERLRAQTWLERVRQEVETDLQAQLAALATNAAEAGEAPHRVAAAETAPCLRRAEELAQRLATIGDEELGRAVRRHLAALLPGRAHDRPDVQG
jgi:hypothetical protein